MTRVMPQTSAAGKCKIAILRKHGPQNPADSDPIMFGNSADCYAGAHSIFGGQRDAGARRDEWPVPVKFGVTFEGLQLAGLRHSYTGLCKLLGQPLAKTKVVPRATSLFAR